MTTSTGRYLRTTVLSRHRTLNVVLPTDRPVAELIPGIVTLLDHDSDGAAWVLQTSHGNSLELERSLSHSGLVDGALLHLRAEHEAPPEPVVADVLDLLESQPPHAGWSVAARSWTLSVLGATLMALGMALWVVAHGSDHALRLAVSALVLVAVSAVASLAGRSALAWSAATLSGAAAVGAVGIMQVQPPLTAMSAAGLLLGAILAVGWCTRLGIAALTAALTWAVLTGSAAGAWAAGAGVGGTGAVLLALSAAILGVLPRAAMSLSGLFDVDARIAGGLAVRRAHAATIVGQAHRALAGAVLVCSAGFAVGGFALARQHEGNPWAIALVVLSLTSWSTRARHFPLAAQRAVMAVSAVMVLAGLAWGTVDTDPTLLPWMVAGLLAGGITVLVAESRTTSALSAALVRRGIQRLEALSILATPACLIGVFGVYADLLQTF